jgi:hypothetical protein
MKATVNGAKLNDKVSFEELWSCFTEDDREEYVRGLLVSAKKLYNRALVKVAMSQLKGTKMGLGKATRTGEGRRRIYTKPGLNSPIGQPPLRKIICEVLGHNKINHPQHYGGDTVYEVIKVLRAHLSREEMIGFLKGNIVKYILRAGKKNAHDNEIDHAKAAWYNNYLVDYLAGINCIENAKTRS